MKLNFNDVSRNPMLNHDRRSLDSVPRLMRLSVLLTLYLFASNALSEPAKGSAVTSIDFDDCETFQADDAEEYVTALCPGVGGFQVLRHADDLRESLSMIDAEGRVRPLDLWSAVSARFSYLGDELLWLLDADGTPHSIEARFYVQAKNTDDYELRTVTIALNASASSGAGPCITAVDGHTVAEICESSAPDSTILAMVGGFELGDRACYVQLDDPAQYKQSQLALFEVCEGLARAASIGALNKRQALVEFGRVAMAASSCEGSIDCEYTEQVRTITRIALSPIPPLHQVAQGTSSHRVLFECETAEGQIRLTHSLNTASISLTLNSRVVDRELSLDGAAAGVVPFAGGGGAWLRVAHTTQPFAVYSGVGLWGVAGELASKAGYVEFSDRGANSEVVSCEGDIRSELGPALFDELSLEPDELEMDFSVLPVVTVLSED